MSNHPFLSSVRNYIYNKEFHAQLRKMSKYGGRPRRIVDELTNIFYYENRDKPLDSLNYSNNGESRIDKCHKFDLGDGYRLVTCVRSTICIILFVGSHDETEQWLDKNRGIDFQLDNVDGTIKTVLKSIKVDGATREVIPDYSVEGKLINKLKDHYKEKLFEGLKRSHIKILEGIESDQINDVLKDLIEEFIEDLGEPKATCIYDVFFNLAEGKIEDAKNAILAYENIVRPIESYSKQDIQTKLKSSDTYLKFEDLDPTTLKMIRSSLDWQDWMLFLHPAQRELVESNYNTPCRLLGVSGSGKTCIVAKRAMRLAEENGSAKILIVTLNRSLSQLIKELMGKLSTYHIDEKVLDRIHVKSFWELSNSLVTSFQPNLKRYTNDYSDTHEESIEEIWKEFVQCETNNDDYWHSMEDLHKHLLASNVNPADYIREEFDFIRSSVPFDKRDEYLTIEREGRAIPITKNHRISFLEGLTKWEEKMYSVGVVDYMGFLKYLAPYLEEIKAEYDHLIIDEMQDFGTQELSILRRLTKEGENDIFMTGDIAQKVYHKHHKPVTAGIVIGNYKKLIKNYRNSREILTAAHNVLISNLSNEEKEKNQDIILEPDYANFSTHKPLLVKAKDFKQQVDFALTYTKNILVKGERACIVFANQNFYQVAEFAKKNGIALLDGNHNLTDSKIFISDLEQTKGFEFDYVVIINVSQDRFPNKNLPNDEKIRSILKLYVSMTRATKELMILYSNEVSTILESSIEYFNTANIDRYENPDQLVDFQLPSSYNITGNTSIAKLREMKARDFILSPEAIGMSSSLLNKLLDIVDGTISTQNGFQVKHDEIFSFFQKVKRGGPRMARLLGRNERDELMNIVKNMGI